MYYNVRLRHLLVTIFAVEKQCYTECVFVAVGIRHVKHCKAREAVYCNVRLRHLLVTIFAVEKQ